MTRPNASARPTTPLASAPPDAALLCPQGGQGSHDGEPLVLPIVQSTTFCRDGLASRAEHRYSRESNPTVAALEQALAALEGAPAAVAYASGLAAEAGLLATVCASGDHVVCSQALYGGTTRLLEEVFGRLGVATTFVDASDVEQLARALTPATKLVFLETPSNPTLAMTDIAAASELAHAAGALVAVDNTFLTAVGQRPLDLGADVSTLSTTKFVEGHSAALGGALVVRDTELAERLAFVRKCTGAIQQPWNAWLTLQGLKTLALRLREQSRSAACLADWLAQHGEVATLHYPGLASAAQADIARRQHLALDPRSNDTQLLHGAVVSFELSGGYERACAVLAEVRLCRLVEHVGSVETLLTHSASMTHGSLSAQQRAAVGVSDGLLRLSVGIEPWESIRDDLERAFEATRAAATVRGGAACASA